MTSLNGDVELASPRRRRFSIILLCLQYVGVALSAIQGFVLVPLYVKDLSVPLYGAWIGVSSAMTWFFLMDPGASFVFQQRVGHFLGRNDKCSLEKALGTGLVLNALIYLAIVMLALLLAPILPRMLGLDPAWRRDLSYCFALAVLGEGALALGLLAASAAIAMMTHPMTFGAVYAVFTLGGIATTAYLLLRGAGLIAIPAGMLVRGVGIMVANWIAACYVCNITLSLRFRYSAMELKDVMRLSIYSWGQRIADGLSTNFDNVILIYFLGPALLPVLTVSRNASDFISQAVGRIGVALSPAMTHLHAGGDVEATFSMTARLLRIVGWMAAMGGGGLIGLNGAFVGLWTGRQLYGGDALNLLLAAAAVWSVLGRTMAKTIFSFGAIKEVSVIGLAESLCRVALLLGLLAVARRLEFAPAAILAAGAMTGAWLLPRLLLRLLHREWGCVFGIAWEVFSSTVVCLGVGVAWRLWLPVPLTWMAFVGQGFFLAATMVLALAIARPAFRAELELVLPLSLPGRNARA